jgi:hypothetical protein
VWLCSSLFLPTFNHFSVLHNDGLNLWSCQLFVCLHSSSLESALGLLWQTLLRFCHNLYRTETLQLIYVRSVIRCETSMMFMLLIEANNKICYVLQDQYEMAHRCVRELFQQHIEALDGNIYANFEPSPGNVIEFCIYFRSFSILLIKCTYCSNAILCSVVIFYSQYFRNH